ncbi:MAG TPA: AMP-binding protein, partial [Thermoanaerobaculia bacterium]|nr:AMP-binding protein [Thermoanaerobaculia bacterium]
MIYTSGTTGRPKAVLVRRSSLASTLAATRAELAFQATDRMPCLAPFSFDIFLFELLSPLLTGGTALLFPLRPALDVERLLGAVEDEGLTLLHAVPALMRQIVNAVRQSAGRRAGAHLRALFVGGDTVPAELLADLRETFPAARIYVLYGPTEGTILASSYAVPEAQPVRSLLGRPLDGVRLELRDAEGGLVPVGVPGEIWLGGPGVACGYWGQPALTAERFVAGRSEGSRFFRTGDLARQLPDGTFEFLGRIDNQVKVRGFRIELGEIESVLARHPIVEAAVVVAREEEAGRSAGTAVKQLVAYVVPDRESVSAARIVEQADQVANWQQIYEETYGRSHSAADPTFNLEGWNSSYTSQPIPAEEMREWVEGTVSRLRELGGRRVLEVGCGTGLLLFRLAPQAERYRGTDFSAEALVSIRRQLAGRLALPQVELDQRLAEDWSGVEPGEFDLIVLNSVVQYFPGVDYLLAVLEGVLPRVAPGGRIFLGDLRSLDLHPAFAA